MACLRVDKTDRFLLVDIPLVCKGIYVGAAGNGPTTMYDWFGPPLVFRSPDRVVYRKPDVTILITYMFYKSIVFHLPTTKLYARHERGYRNRYCGASGVVYPTVNDSRHPRLEGKRSIAICTRTFN